MTRLKARRWNCQPTNWMKMRMSMGQSRLRQLQALTLRKEATDGLSRVVSPIILNKMSEVALTIGSFTLMFLYAGTLYSWGIFQADLARRQVASSLLLSTVGALQAFCQAVACMPVSYRHLPLIARLLLTIRLHS